MGGRTDPNSWDPSGHSLGPTIEALVQTPVEPNHNLSPKKLYYQFIFVLCVQILR